MYNLKQVISAIISIWLWANHHSSFEKAFEKNGRIDVDHHCKWLINAAVEKGTIPLLSTGLSSFSNDTEERNVVGNLGIATVVSRALMEGLSFNNEMVSNTIVKFWFFISIDTNFYFHDRT